MTRTPRFTDSYGRHRQVGAGWSRYRLRKGDGWGPWIGDISSVTQDKTAVRLRPVISDFVSPTPWGAYAKNVYIPEFDYETENHQWQGEGSITTMGVNLRGYPAGCVISDDNTSVIVNVPSWMVTNAVNEARSGLSSGWNAAVFFGELNESVGMIADILQRIYRALRAAKRGDWYNAYRQLGARSYSVSHDASSNYLQLQLGIVPLIRDMYELQEHIKAGLSREGNFIESEASEVATMDTRTVLGGDSANSKKYSGSGSKYGVRVKFRARISSPVLHNLNRLGILNPVAVAWELVPLSFVIDWFLPIGAFLNALTGPLGTTFVSGFQTTFIESQLKCNYCRYGWPGYRRGTPQFLLIELFAMQRRKLTSFPLPGIGWGGGIQSVRRALLALALIRQRT